MYCTRINNVVVKYRLKDKRLTKDLFVRAYNKKSDYPNFHAYVEAKQKKIGNRMEMGTWKTHRTVFAKLKDYAPALYFDELTPGWLDDYFLHLRGRLANNDNTAYKNMAVIKKYVRMAVRDGYIEENPFEHWRIKRGTPSCVYLTEDELERMVQLYRSGELEEKLHRVTEFFLFLCFSSLHIGDARALTLEQFTDTSFTYYRMKLRNSKPAPVTVPVSEPAALLRNITGTRRKGKVFAWKMADQTINRLLKDVAAILEIDKPLTAKVGRHTFATIFLRRTKDIAALKEILGHSDLKETLVYAHVLDESKREGMRCFNGFKI